MRRFTIMYEHYSHARQRHSTRTIEGCTFSDGSFAYIHTDRPGGRGVMIGQTEQDIYDALFDADDQPAFTWLDDPTGHAGREGT